MSKTRFTVTGPQKSSAGSRSLASRPGSTHAISRSLAHWVLDAWAIVYRGRGPKPQCPCPRPQCPYSSLQHPCSGPSRPRLGCPSLDPSMPGQGPWSSHQVLEGQTQVPDVEAYFHRGQARDPSMPVPRFIEAKPKTPVLTTKSLEVEPRSIKVGPRSLVPGLSLASMDIEASSMSTRRIELERGQKFRNRYGRDNICDRDRNIL